MQKVRIEGDGCTQVDGEVPVTERTKPFHYRLSILRFWAEQSFGPDVYIGSLRGEFGWCENTVQTVDRGVRAWERIWGSIQYQLGEPVKYRSVKVLEEISQLIPDQMEEVDLQTLGYLKLALDLLKELVRKEEEYLEKLEGEGRKPFSREYNSYKEWEKYSGVYKEWEQPEEDVVLQFFEDRSKQNHQERLIIVALVPWIERSVGFSILDYRCRVSLPSGKCLPPGQD